MTRHGTYLIARQKNESHAPQVNREPDDLKVRMVVRLKRSSNRVPKSPFGKSGMSVSADEDAAHGDVDHGG